MDHVLVLIHFTGRFFQALAKFSNAIPLFMTGDAGSVSVSRNIQLGLILKHSLVFLRGSLFFLVCSSLWQRRNGLLRQIRELRKRLKLWLMRTVVRADMPDANNTLKLLLMIHLFHRIFALLVARLALRRLQN